jgi:hypothetical protein
VVSVNLVGFRRRMANELLPNFLGDASRKLAIRSELVRSQ